MRRIVLPEFDPARPLFVRRPMTANGHRFKAGDPFDWKKMAISQRKAKKLFETGHLRHPAEGKEPVQEPAPEKPQDTVAAVTNEDSEIADEGVEDGASALDETEEGDELDAIDDIATLRDIAMREGAQTTRSKDRQRELIRENRQ